MMKYGPRIYFVLLDQHNDIAAWATTSKDAANAMSMFSTRVKMVNMEFKKNILTSMSMPEFQDLEKCLRLTYRKATRATLEIPNSDAIRAYREEIAIRTRCQEKLVRLCDQAMQMISDTNRFNDYASTIMYEMSQCDDTAGVYSEGIKTYAASTNCEPRSAYQELKMQMENLAHARMRNLGIYIKYRNLLNDSAGDQESQSAVINAATDELIRNSMV